MPSQVRAARPDRRDVLPLDVGHRDPAVVLQRLHGGHHHHGARPQPREPALEVEELLGAEVGPEAGLGHHDVVERERGPGRQHRVAPVRDVGERSAVHEDRRVLEGLHQVGLQGVRQQDRECVLRLEVGRRDRHLVAGVAHDDPPDALLEVRQRRGQAEDRHQLAGDDDVPPVLAGEPVAGAAQPHHDLAEGPVVHVDDPLPGDRARVDAERVAVVDVVVDQGSQQVVGRRDRREVTGEVEVDVGHRHHLGVAAPGGAALHPEHRTHAGLAQRRRGPDADVAQPVGEAHHRGGLALTGRGRRDGRDQHQPARRSALEGRQPRPVQLRHVAAVRDQRLVGHAELLLGDPADRPQLGRLGDLYVAGQVAGHLAGHLLSVRSVRRPRRDRGPGAARAGWG